MTLQTKEELQQEIVRHVEDMILEGCEAVACFYTQEPYKGSLELAKAMREKLYSLLHDLATHGKE